MKETRSCREYMLKVNDPDSKANCATCVKFDREEGRCRDEEGVKKRYEDTVKFDIYNRMMRDAKDIRVD